VKKDDLLIKISEKARVRKETSKRVTQALIKAIGESIKSGDKVTLSGLGTFRIKPRKAKPARNLQTGEIVYLPEGKKISFKPSLSFKKLLKEGYDPLHPLQN
jgi:nucleoid DNA-binding protein